MCYSRQLDTQNILYVQLKDLSDKELAIKKNILNSKIRKSWVFSTLFSIASIGSIIATAISAGTAAPGTIPAAAVSSVSAGDHYDKIARYTSEIEIIDKIMLKRRQSEIKIVKNKSDITIVSSDYSKKHN